MINLSPEQELLDNLYELQSARERGGISSEPALISDRILDNSSVFIDYKTCTHEISEFGEEPNKVIMDGTRIVLSDLPLDSEEFDGARLWIGNTQKGLEIANNVISKNTLFFIGKTLSVQCVDLDEDMLDGQRTVYDFDTQALADMLKVPQAILPLPVSEEDPREVPEDLTKLWWPQNNAFTLGAGIFQREIESNARLIADEVGYIRYDQTEYGAAFYRLRITESLDDIHHRETEFDRVLIANIEFPKTMQIGVYKFGDSSEYYLKSNAVKVKIRRAGMSLYGPDDDGRQSLYMPSTKTQTLIDQVLHSAGIIELDF